MSRLGKLGRSLFVVVAMLMALPSFAAQASGGYYFEPNSSKCGDFAPIQPTIDPWSRGDRYQVDLEFTITQEQIDAEGCAGSHFNLQIDLDGFSSKVDWNSCSVDYEHQYTFGWGIADNGRGDATVTIYGAKFVEGRMYPGYKYWIEINCSNLWPDRHIDPSVSVTYIGTWWSTNLDEPGCEATDFVTSGTKGPAGLPVCVEYTRRNAQLLNSHGDTKFLFDD